MEVLVSPLLVRHAAFLRFNRRLIRVQVSRYRLGKIFHGVEILIHTTGRRRSAHTVPEEFPSRAQAVNHLAQESAACGLAHASGKLPSIGFIPGMRQLMSDRPGGEGTGIVANHAGWQDTVNPGVSQFNVHGKGQRVDTTHIGEMVKDGVKQLQFAFLPIALERKTRLGLDLVEQRNSFGVFLHHCSLLYEGFAVYELLFFMPITQS